MPNQLTKEQIDQYGTLGYVKGLKIFDVHDMKQLNAGFDRLVSLLPEGTVADEIQTWNDLERMELILTRLYPEGIPPTIRDQMLWAARFIFDIAVTPAILDYVESLIGPDFFFWGTQFFCKMPHDPRRVPWHQDARYWPLTPHKTVTAWVAFDDVDDENSAMRVIPGTQTIGMVDHATTDFEQDVLHQQIDPKKVDESKAVTINLRRGEISLHNDNLIHGSGPNRSARRRCGLTIRYAPTEVRFFEEGQEVEQQWRVRKAFMARGVDRYHVNRTGVSPHEIHSVNV